MKEKHITVIYQEYPNIEELDEQARLLVENALQAAKNAYAPYSKFHVGATILLQNGIVISGNNQENAAYPSGLCAERVALFSASATYPQEPIIAMAITALSEQSELKTPPFPCGACRQVLAEYEHRQHKPIRLILHTSSNVIVVNGIKNLLPFPFVAG